MPVKIMSLKITNVRNTIFNFINNAILDENAGKCGEWIKSYLVFICKCEEVETWEELLDKYR